MAAPLTILRFRAGARVGSHSAAGSLWGSCVGTRASLASSLEAETLSTSFPGLCSAVRSPLAVSWGLLCLVIPSWRGGVEGTAHRSVMSRSGGPAPSCYNPPPARRFNPQPGRCTRLYSFFSLSVRFPKRRIDWIRRQGFDSKILY